MKRSPLSICCLAALTAVLAGADLLSQQLPVSEPADAAAPRTDQNSLLAHAQLVEKARKGGIDIYFEGDSIVRRWGATDYPEFLANWKQNFFGWNAANFGWGADRTQNILWRLQNGELDGVHPKVIVLLAGTNNVGNTTPPEGDDAKVAEISRGLQAIVRVMQAKAPEATIIVTGIFPRNDNMAVMPTIEKINRNLSRLADGRKILYLDINDRLADREGKLYDGMMHPGDKLHPTLKGYQVWADALKPLFTKLLGPPGQEDHAPPPTGNPSARPYLVKQGTATQFRVHGKPFLLIAGELGNSSASSLGYMNAALIRPGYQPGQYPSAGPLPHLIDVWRAAAPAIDFIAPDIYFKNFAEWCAKYDRSGNPLFIPEAQSSQSVANAFFAIARHNAMGYSPFSIESLDEKRSQHVAGAYDVLRQLAPVNITLLALLPVRRCERI